MQQASYRNASPRNQRISQSTMSLMSRRKAHARCEAVVGTQPAKNIIRFFLLPGLIVDSISLLTFLFPPPHLLLFPH